MAEELKTFRVTISKRINRYNDCGGLKSLIKDSHRRGRIPTGRKKRLVIINI